MIKDLPYPEITNLLIYPVIILLLIAYHVFARRRKHGFKIPVGLFITYFLVLSATKIVKHFELISALKFLELAATILLTLAIIRFITFIIVDYLMRYRKLAPIPTISRDIGLVVVYIIAILIILRYKADVNLASLITTSAVLTAVIGLALQDTLGNLFAGIVLQMEKPYRIGDWVGFDTYIGRVVGMTWKSTKIVTREKELVCIPNNIIAKSHILNYSQPDPLHTAVFEIGVSYKDPPNNVREAILNTLTEHPKVHRTPAPEIRVVRYNDFSIDYLVRFFISDFENEERLKSHILNQLWYRFKREGLTIPFPIRTIQHAKPEAEKEAGEKDVATHCALDNLSHIDLFSPLSEEEFMNLARHARFERFSPGEIIIREGAFGKSMYAIVSGECNIIVPKEDYGEHIVATLKENQFFGEMSLLTGEPRSATVKANTDVTCIKIEKGDLQGIIESHPAVATAMSEILATRKEDLEAQKEGLKKAKPDKKLATQLLAKIKTFFNIW